jgi:HSP20 family protein
MTLVKENRRRFPATRSSLMTNEPAFTDLFDLSKNMFNLKRFFNDDFGNGTNGFPSLNVRDLKDNYEVQLAAPGLEKSDFNITMDNGILTITAEKEEKQEEEKEGFVRKEFSYNSFSRSIMLPDFIDEDKEVKASYKDGVLKLLLKKNEKANASPKTIKVS